MIGYRTCHIYIHQSKHCHAVIEIKCKSNSERGIKKRKFVISPNRKDCD